MEPVFELDKRFAGLDDGLFGAIGAGAAAAGQGFGAGAQAAGQGIGQGGQQAGAGVASGASTAAQGISQGAGNLGAAASDVADSAATAAKWAIALAIGIPAAAGLALLTAVVILGRGAAKTAGVVLPAAFRSAPELLPFLMPEVGAAQGAARFAEQAGQWARPAETNLLPSRRRAGGTSGQVTGRFSARGTIPTSGASKTLYSGR
jgi:hypothetical protein